MNKDVVGPALGAVVPVLGAALIGGQANPGRPRAALWYAGLRKPSFTPPGPAIGAAWMVLYGLIGFGGYRLLRARHGAARNAALAGWGGTVSGIALFPWAFFGKRDLVSSGAVTAGMLAAAGTSVAAASQVDRPAAAALSPVVAWVTFALLLNEELWRRNR